MSGYSSLISFHGDGTYRSSHVLQPLIQPLAQCHPALLSQLNALIRLDALPEFGCQFLLGICVDVAEDGITVFLVANYDAPFPSSIFPLAHHAVT